MKKNIQKEYRVIKVPSFHYDESSSSFFYLPQVREVWTETRGLPFFKKEVACQNEWKVILLKNGDYILKSAWALQLSDSFLSSEPFAIDIIKKYKADLVRKEKESAAVRQFYKATCFEDDCVVKDETYFKKTIL